MEMGGEGGDSWKGMAMSSKQEMREERQTESTGRGECESHVQMTLRRPKAQILKGGLRPGFDAGRDNWDNMVFC